MKSILFLTLMFLLTACEERQSTQEEIKENQTLKAENRLKEKSDDSFKEKDILKKLGFVFDGEKITIDMNKTTEFMKKMEIEMHGKADEIERKIEKRDINFSRDFGIEIDETHFAVDLNKTRDMLQQINILMKDILLDENNTIH